MTWHPAFFNSTRESLRHQQVYHGAFRPRSLLTSPQPNGASRPAIFLLVLLSAFDFIVAGFSLDVMQAGFADVHVDALLRFRRQYVLSHSARSRTGRC